MPPYTIPSLQVSTEYLKSYFLSKIWATAGKTRQKGLQNNSGPMLQGNALACLFLAHRVKWLPDKKRKELHRPVVTAVVTSS